MESKFVNLNGVRFNFGEGAANGPRLAFLPGFPRYWTEYEPLIRELEPHYHVFALSMRGQGRSEWAPPYTISSYIADTTAFLREVVGPSAFGLAHSAGAWFGLAAANDFPEFFKGFISIDQPLDPEDHLIAHGKDTSAVKEMLDAMRSAADVDQLQARLTELRAPDDMSAEELREEAVHLSHIDPETFAPWSEGLENWICVPELQRWPGKYRAPILFLDGDPNQGSMLSAKAVSYNLSHYPWAKRVELKGLDHVMGLRSDPLRAVVEIRRFFDGLARQSGCTGGH
ncbi:alpha/beta fold hydrolase [Roseibium sp.]|uniref:alpha/beta fold hydrolase n=2 Tax=Roseibium sp. TaxID=1936156 RepID=UPI003D11A9BB